MISPEPARGDRAGGDQDALADAASEHVEGDDAAAAVHLDLEERAVRDPVDPLGRPHGAGDGRSQHGRSFSISTPRLRARSRAIGVSTARGASTSRAPWAAASRTARSVTAPRSIRIVVAAAGAAAAAAVAPRRKRSLPDRIAIRSRGFSNRWI